MSTFNLKYRDTAKVLEAVLLDDASDTTSAHDLTDAAEVWLHVSLGGAGGVLGPAFSRQMTVAGDPVDGTVQYQFVATDWTDTPKLRPGDFSMEIEVLNNDSTRQTFPDDGYDVLSVVNDIGQTT